MSENDNIKSELKSLTSISQDQNKKLDRLLVAVEGDPKIGLEGLATRVQRHDDFVRNSNLREAKHKGVIIAIGFLGGILAKFWDKIWDRLW